jgi:hypothetical protein
MNTDYSQVLTANYPGAQWTLNGDTYDGLTWLDSSAKPTQDELDAAWPAVQYANQCKAVEQARLADYEKTSDPLFFKWQRGDATEQEWLAAVQAVKDAHPYPPES